MKTKVIGNLITEVITKEFGEKLLAGCTNERKVKKGHVKLLENSIREGWNNSSIISVTDDGELLDGQHRLHALKNLGWPRFVIQVCIYRREDVTPALRTSFNKAARQKTGDSMKMAYNWSNPIPRCSILNAIYQSCISNGGYCDDFVTYQMDKAFGDEVEEFIGKEKNRHLTGEQVACFVMMRILEGPSSSAKLHELFNNVTKGLNFDSVNCIGKRIYDFIHAVNYRGIKITHIGLKRPHLFRICHAISLMLAGKKTCGILENIKDEDIIFIRDRISSVISKRYNETNF